MAAPLPPYGVAIRDAIASKSLIKMKAVAEKAKKYIRDQKDISVALLNLQEAIEKMEKK